jgi:hypothetical protein
MGRGLNWEKARRDANADKQTTGLDLLRDPTDEMNEIARMKQAQQRKGKKSNTRARLAAVEVAPELAAQAAREARHKARLIDQALTFEERKAAALLRYAKEKGAALSASQLAPSSALPPERSTCAERTKRKVDRPERNQRREARTARNKMRKEWCETLSPEQSELKIQQLREETRIARKKAKETAKMPPW